MKDVSVLHEMVSLSEQYDLLFDVVFTSSYYTTSDHTTTPHTTSDRNITPHTTSDRNHNHHPRQVTPQCN